MPEGAAPIRGYLMRAGKPPMGAWERQHENVLWASDSGGRGGRGGNRGGSR